jgi:hypothetical protein
MTDKKTRTALAIVASAIGFLDSAFKMQGEDAPTEVQRAGLAKILALASETFPDAALKYKEEDTTALALVSYLFTTSPKTESIPYPMLEMFGKAKGTVTIEGNEVSTASLSASDYRHAVEMHAKLEDKASREWAHARGENGKPDSGGVKRYTK